MAIETGLSGRAVVVTGAAAGIGRATALRFAREGASVSVWDVDAARGTAVVHELESAGGRGAFACVDVTDTPAVETAMAQAARHWGRLDVLVNNAGIVRDGLLVKVKDGEVLSTMGDEVFDAVVDVNLRAVFKCTRAAVPHLVRQGGGVVLNASSVVGLYGNFGQTNYVATKAGVIGMTRTWARELGKHKIRVNAVAPGFISTDILQSVPEKVIASMVSHTPLGRMGLPEDIANAYVWLASDGAAFVTGAVLSVDGGLVVGT